MRLHIDRWYGPPARIALELSPGTRVRPAAAYFRAGHLLLDELTRRLVTVTDLNDPRREDRAAAAAAALSTPDTSVAVARAIPVFSRAPQSRGSALRGIPTWAGNERT